MTATNDSANGKGPPSSKPALERSARPRAERREGNDSANRPKVKPGPKTAAARAAVSRNAVKHGLTSADPVIAGMEDDEEWYEFYRGIEEALAPEGRLEEALVERIALLAWRLRRVIRYEAAVTTRGVAATERNLAIGEAYAAGTLSTGDLPEMNPEYVAAHEEARMLPDADEIDKIIRYETHLHRQWLQTLHELEAIQARRRGEATYLARVDFNASPPA
ncbi:MAG: hypothetical protein WEE64_14320 [Dehalococcoidia bacterium]